MKKLALAALLSVTATVATAQTVEVYGKIHLYQERIETGTASAVTKLSNDSSRIGFRGTENLGGGLKAFFVLETAVNTDAPDSANDTKLGDRTSIVGLNNAFGSVALGRDKHQIARVFDAFDAFGNASFGSPIATIHAAQGSRFSNAAFVTVTPFKGVAAHYQRSSSEVDGVKSAQAFGADAAFGPVSTSVARYDNGLTGASKSASTTVGAKIALNASGTTLFGVYSDDEVLGVTSQGKTVGITQKLGAPLTVLASYGTKQGVDAYAVGATYSLSKRTFLHARYRNENADDNTKDVKQVGLGIEHRF